MPVAHSEPFVNSRNNFVYFGGVPILYWPTFSTSLERPTSYVSGVRFKNDNIFGTQVFLDLDLFQIFGIENAPRGVEWDLSLDYLSDRGPAIGTTSGLQTSLGIWGVAGPVRGYFDTWVIHDDGLDTLGRDRQDLVPENTTRGRVVATAPPLPGPRLGIDRRARLGQRRQLPRAVPRERVGPGCRPSHRIDVSALPQQSIVWICRRMRA